MSGMKSIRLALQVATAHRDAAGKALAQTRQSHGGALDQMRQLEHYAIETEAKWAVSSRTLANPEIVRHYYHFMARLQQATDLQARVVIDLERQAQAARQVLLDAEIRVAGLNRLLERKHADMLRQRVIGEQKLNDEFAAQQHRRMPARLSTEGTP